MDYEELVVAFADRRNIDLPMARAIVDLFFEELAQGLEAGGRVELRGFATWSVHHHAGFHGVHPRTGLPHIVAPRKRPFFKPSPVLHRLLNPEK